MKKFWLGLILSLFLATTAFASFSNQTNKVFGSGDGVTQTFSFPFKIFNKTDLQVYEINTSGTVFGPLTLNSDYTVAISSTTEGGTVTFTTAPTVNWQTFIKRVEPLTQSLAIATEGPLPSKQIENQLDRAMMVNIQNAEAISRSVLLPVTTTLSSLAFPNPSANQVLAWDPTGTSLVNVDSDVAAQAAAAASAASALSYANTASSAASTATTQASNASGSAISAAASAASATATLASAVKGDGSVNPTNLLSNGDFECWSAGASAAPDGWTVYIGDETIAQGSTTPSPKLGSYYAEITNAGSAAGGVSQSVHVAKGIEYWKSRTVTFGCWVRTATGGSRVYLKINDGVGESFSNMHTGNSTWQWLSVTRTIDASAISVTPICYIATGTAITADFDGAMCVEGESAFAFADKPVNNSRILFGTFVANGVTPVTVANNNVAITDAIIISLNTVGGTVGVHPAIQTITAGTGFTVACTALDTSTYNYCLIKQ